MSLVEFLRYAGTNAGINAIAGFVLSFVAEWVPGYEAMAPKPKRLVMMALCFVIPILSLGGLWLLAADPITVDAVWLALVAGFSAFFGSQAAHTRKLPSQPVKETVYSYDSPDVPAGAILRSTGNGGKEWVVWE